MKPFFRKRRIEEPIRRARSLLVQPAVLKVFLLLALFGGAVSLQLWVGDLQRSASRLDGPSPEESRSDASLPIAPVPHSKKTPSGRIDINTAPLEELASLPGIGPKLAEEIDTYRHQRGPFREAGDLLAVRGIGPRRARRIAPYLSFDGSS